jgi:hypothetical protein
MTVKAWYSSSGSLMISEHIPGVTQELNDETSRFYQGKHFVCETIMKSAAKRLAEAMGWEWSKEPVND